MHTSKLLHVITWEVGRKQAITVAFSAEHSTGGARLKGPAASGQHLETHILEGQRCSVEKSFVQQLYKQDDEN